MLDAHQHFWTVARGDYAWMSPDLKPLYRDFGPADLAPLMAKAGITRTILVQAAETEAETDFLLAIAAKTDFVAGVVGWLDMTSADFPARLAHYKTQAKWVGLRPMLQEHDEGMILQPQFLANLKHVANSGTAYDILTHPRHLPNVITALAQAPNLHAVVDHISKPLIASGALDPWRADIAVLAAMPNIYCKVSGMVTEAGTDWTLDRLRAYVAHIAAVFGPDRLIFGSDWPVCTLAATHAQVVDSTRQLLAEIFSADQVKAIFEDNGRKFYRV